MLDDWNGNVRVKRNFVYSYSNKIKIAPFCRAQCNGIFAERGSQRTKKLRAIEILDIFAWVHYTSPSNVKKLNACDSVIALQLIACLGLYM